MMKNPIATIGIPLLVLVVSAFLLESAAFCYAAAGIVAFVIFLACSGNMAERLPTSLKCALAILLLMIAGYLLWGLGVLDGSPTEWPRNYPYPDKLVMAVHESMHPASVMLFGNQKTFLVLGAAIAVCCAVAGWLLQDSKLSTLLHGPSTETQLRREFYFRSLRGAVVGVAIGLFPAAMFGKSFPLALLLLPVSTFVGAALAVKEIEAGEES